MEQAIVDSVQLGGSVDKDLSIMGLFLAADPVVKAVDARSYSRLHFS